MQRELSTVFHVGSDKASTIPAATLTLSESERLWHWLLTSWHSMKRSLPSHSQARVSIEDLIGQLTEQFTVVIVTHSMQRRPHLRLHRVLHLGEIVEVGPTNQLFMPKEKRTEDYITGRFG